jgi:hypothetical protein
MTMQMQRAFSSRMQTPLTLHKVNEGSYDDDNNWVQGSKKTTSIFGVITAGNKFSQFDEGISLHSEDGGARYSNYRNLYVKDKYQVSRGDKVSFRDAYYNVLQESDEQIFGFSSFILEKSEDGTP